MKSATTASTAMPQPSMKIPVCPVATKLVLWPRLTSSSRSCSCAVIFPTLQSDPTASTTSASTSAARPSAIGRLGGGRRASRMRSEEHTSELQSLAYLVCRLLLEKKKKKVNTDESSL